MTNTNRTIVTKRFRKELDNGETLTATAEIHSIGNQEPYFSITGEVRRYGNWDRAGYLHDEIAAHIPELTLYLKYHCVSTVQPMHYLANTLYHVKQGKLDDARSAAVWLGATDDELMSENLREVLIARLPRLMDEFRAAMVELFDGQVSFEPVAA